MNKGRMSVSLAIAAVIMGVYADSNAGSGAAPAPTVRMPPVVVYAHPDKAVSRATMQQLMTSSLAGELAVHSVY